MRRIPLPCRFVFVFAAAATTACSTPRTSPEILADHSAPRTPAKAAPSVVATERPPSGAAPETTKSPPKLADTTTHPWSFAATAERLEARFPPPKGFVPISAPPGSFAEFARDLPLAPPDTPVVDFRGAKLYDDGRHDNIAAVVDIDVGTRDLQQCADAILRMNAEWRYGRAERDVRYRAVSGVPMSYTKYLKGERTVVDGGKMSLRMTAAPVADDHKAFRAYLDEVFGWANTTSVEKEGQRVPFADVRAGDFFVMPGSPFGHAVLVLDVAKGESGRTALLLGQSYMPAQSFQILRPTKTSTWFVVERTAKDVTTPFWAPFPLESLRRLP